MEMKQQISLKSYDTRLFLEAKTAKKRTLYDAAAFKVAVLYKMARRQNIYAFMQLIQIEHKLTALNDTLRKKMVSTKRSLRKKLGYTPKVKMPPLLNRELGFSNPIHFGLIQVLKSFDEYISILLLARSSLLFDHQNSFFKVKNRYRASVFKVFSEIIAISAKDFPHTSINDYIEGNDAYQSHINTFGKLEPQMLYNAIQSTVTPTLSPEALNRINKQLKVMAIKGESHGA